MRVLSDITHETHDKKGRGSNLDSGGHLYNIAST